jgi:hypothetical protein
VYANDAKQNQIVDIDEITQRGDQDRQCNATGHRGGFVMARAARR